MSLYDDIDIDVSNAVAAKVARAASPLSGQKEKASGGWSHAGLKLLQSQIKLKKASQTQIKRDRLRGSGPDASTTVVDLTARNRAKKAQVVEVDEMPPPLSFLQQDRPLHGTDSPPQAAPGGFYGDLEIRDEYDPRRPNDFDALTADRGSKRSNKDRRRNSRFNSRDSEQPARRRNGEAEGSTFEEHNAEHREACKEADKRSMGAAIAPPSSLTETINPATTSAPQPQQQSAAAPEEQPEATTSRALPGPAGPKGLAFAANLMQKYGYKQGQGLGKLQQGMSTALRVEKTGRVGGKIISERDAPSPPPNNVKALDEQQQQETETQSDQPEPINIAELLKRPSKIVLLKNMVGPGEVDDDLETEVKEECGKYGDVQKCTVFELPDVSETEAVRIFLEFARIEHAIKAVVDLHSRYFGGRQISASFYNEERYLELELAD